MHLNCFKGNISIPGSSLNDSCIQEKHPATPVVVISGNSNEEDAEELIALGGFEYLTKPFQLEDVEDAVNRALTRHQEQQNASQSEGAGAN